MNSLHEQSSSCRLFIAAHIRIKAGNWRLVNTPKSMAEDENRQGNIFQYQAEVESATIDPDPAAGFPSWQGLNERKVNPKRPAKPMVQPPMEDNAR
jgi:hypothetical protein